MWRWFQPFDFNCDLRFDAIGPVDINFSLEIDQFSKKAKDILFDPFQLIVSYMM